MQHTERVSLLAKNAPVSIILTSRHLVSIHEFCKPLISTGISQKSSARQGDYFFALQTAFCRERAHLVEAHKILAHCILAYIAFVLSLLEALCSASYCCACIGGRSAALLTLRKLLLIYAHRRLFRHTKRQIFTTITSPCVLRSPCVILSLSCSFWSFII
jgi:hypothetical protein